MDIKQTTFTQNKLLRINIDKNWSSTDFSNLFTSLSFLYQLCLELECIDDIEFKLKHKITTSILSQNLLNINGDLYNKLNFPSTYKNAETIDSSDLLTSRYTRKLDHSLDLQVGQIKFSSPGNTDFIGLGKIMEQIFSLIKFYIPSKEQRLSNQKAELDLVTKKINILRKLGYDKMEIRKFYDVRDNAVLNLKQLSYEEKISGVEIKKIED